MARYAFFEGRFVPVEDAKISIMAHAFNYGTGCFEGIRAYWNDQDGQLYVFRLREHFERMHRSSRILRIQLKHSPTELCDLTLELLRKEGLLAGSSSGTLLAAALQYCREQTEPKRVVTFACDTGNKYLSKLYNDFWLEDQGFVSRPQHDDLRDLIGRPHGERATITVGPTDILTTAHNRLRNAGFSQLPVMEDGKLIGVVTEDALIHFVYGHPELMTAPVRDAMESAFIRLDKSESLNNLVAMLHVQPYAAIMDGDEFQGLITRSDVLNYLRRQV